MEFTPADSSLFRSSMEALKDFLPTATLRVTRAGLRVNGLDASHIGFVDYFLAAADMSASKIPNHETTIGLNIALFCRVLSNVGSGDVLTIRLSESRDRIVVDYTNDRVSKRGHYELHTLDISEEALAIPELVHDADVTLKTADMLSTIREISAFGDVLELCLNEDGFDISAVGDAGVAKQTLENTDDREMALRSGDAVSAKYATKFLQGLIKGGAPLSSTTRLEFDGTKPMRVSFKFGHGSHFVGYLAPRIADD